MITYEIYSGVTSDKIVLSYHDSSSMNKQDFCSILVNNHNYGKNPGPGQTNRNYHQLGLIHNSTRKTVSIMT